MQPVETAVAPAVEQTEPPLKELWNNLRHRDPSFKVEYKEFEADMADEDNLRQLHENLSKMDKTFTVPYAEFVDDMGLKKKEPSKPLPEPEKPFVEVSNGLPPAAASAVDTLRPDLESVQGLGSGLAGLPEFVDPPAAPPQPALPPQLTGLAGQIDTASASPGLRLAPGDEYVGTGAAMPSGAQLRQQTEDAAMAKLADLPGTTNPDVREIENKNALGEMPQPLAYGMERVVVPKEHDAQLPANTVTDAKSGLRYFDRPLSRKVDGKEQTVYESAKALLHNSMVDMVKGIGEGAAALGNTINSTPLGQLNPYGDAYDASMDKTGALLDTKLRKVSDLASRQSVSIAHPETWVYKSAEYAPMVIAQVAQTLAGASEAKVGVALAKTIGLASTIAFDAPFFAGAAKDAERAGLSGANKARYIILQGSLVLGGFKGGSKLMGELGDKLAIKFAPDAARNAIALDATQSLAALESNMGRAATADETKQALSASLQKVMPGMLNIPKQMAQQSMVFAGAEAAKIGANQALAPLLGGTADKITPMQALEQIGGGFVGGATTGLITGAGEALLGAIPTRGAKAGEPVAAPFEAAPESNLGNMLNRIAPLLPTTEAAPESQPQATTGNGESVFNRPRVLRKDFPQDEQGDTDYTQANIKHWDALTTYISGLKDGLITDASGATFQVHDTSTGTQVLDSNGDAFFKKGRFTSSGSPMKGDLTFKPVIAESVAPEVQPEEALAEPTQQRGKDGRPIIGQPRDPNERAPDGSTYEPDPPKNTMGIVGAEFIGKTGSGATLKHQFRLVDKNNDTVSLLETSAANSGKVYEAISNGTIADMLQGPALSEGQGSAPAKIAAAVDLSDERQSAQDAADEHNDLGRTERGGMDGIKKRQEVKAMADAAGLTYSLSADNKVTLTDPNASAVEPATSPAAVSTTEPAEPATTPVFARRRPTAADGEFVLAKNDGSKPGAQAERFRVDEKSGRLTRQQADGRWAYVPRSEYGMLQQQAQKYGFHADTPVEGTPEKTYLTPFEVATSIKQQFKDKLNAAESALSDAGDTTPTRTITKAVADGLRPVVEQAIRDNNLDVKVKEITSGEGGYTYVDPDSKQDVSETNPNITLVLSGNPEHIHELMKALNQGADQISGNSMAPVTPQTEVSAEAAVHPTLVIDLPKGMSPEALNSMMDEFYKLKDKEGKTVLTGFTRIGDRILIGSHFFDGDNFADSLREVKSNVVAILQDNSINSFKIHPYEVLSYNRPAEPTATETTQGQEPVDGAAGVDSQVQRGNGGKRDANLDSASPLAAGFGRYYDSVLEGLNPDKGAIDSPVEPPAAEPPSSEPALGAEDGSGETKTRASAETMAKAGISAALLERMKISGSDQYVPMPHKKLMAIVADIVKSEGVDAAYATAIKDGSGGLPLDVMTVLRMHLLGHYEGVSRRLEALPGGEAANQTEFDQALDHAQKVAESLSGAGTEEAKSLGARRLLTQYSPTLAVAAITRDVNENHAADSKKLQPKANEQTKKIVKQKKDALQATIASPAIKAALEALSADPTATTTTTLPPPAAKPATTTTPPAAADPTGWGSRNKTFTKTSLAEAKAALRKMGFLGSALPPEFVHFIGYHMEAGARGFKAMSEKMVRDFGDKVKPMLREGYELAKKALIAKGDSGQGFDGPDAVQAALNDELGAALADRVVGLAKPKVPGGPVDPVREMLDTLTKMVRETMEKAGDKTPKSMRDVIAAAVNNREQYSDVLESSKQLVIDRIDSLKVSQATKDDMHDKLEEYHQLIIGRPYADQQFARAMDEAMNIAKDNYAGDNRGEQLNNQAKADDSAVSRDRAAIMEHVSAGIKDPALKASVAREAGDEFDARIEERRRNMRIRADVGNVQPNVADDEQIAGPKQRIRPRTLPEQVRDLLGTRATDERVGDKVAPQAVREGLHSLGQRLAQIARDHLSDPTETSSTLADEFVKRAGLTGKQARTFADSFNKEFAAQIAADKEKAINDAYNRAIRTGKTVTPKDVTDRINHLYGLAPTNPDRVLGLVAMQSNLPFLTPADNAQLKKLAGRITDAKGENAKAIATHHFHIAVKNMRGISRWSKLKSGMYSSMLSGATTSIKNIVTTGVNVSMDLFYATGWAAFKGIQHSYRSGDWNALSLVAVPVKGMFNTQGMDYAYQMMRTGVRPPGFEGKFDEASDLEAMAASTDNSVEGRLSRYYAKAQLFAPRGLSTNDLVWQGGTENMWAYNLSMNEAINEGRKQPSSAIWMAINDKLYDTSYRLADAYQQAEDDIASELGPKPGFGIKRLDYNNRISIRVRELMTESRNEQIKVESKRMAAESAFNGPMVGVIGDIMSRFGHLTEAEMGYGVQPGKVVMPFTRIVANVTNANMNYGPVGVIRAWQGKIGVNGNKFEHIYSPMERAIVGAKSISIAAVLATIYAINKDRVDGWLTGAGPSDPNKNREWMLRGNRPYTIDGWNYKDSMLYYGLAGVAGIREAEQFEGADFDKDTYWMDRGTRMVVAAFKAGFNTMSITGTQDFMNAMNDQSKGKDPSQRLVRYAQRQAGTTAINMLIPNASLLRGVSRSVQQYSGSTKREATDPLTMVGQELPGVRDGLPQSYDNLGNTVPVNSNIPFVPISIADDPDTKTINAFMAKNGTWIPTLQRYQSDMHILTLRNGMLSAADRVAMATMTDPQRRALLLKNLGGEEPMPQEQWDIFFPKRGKIIKKMLMAEMPILEAYAKISPRMLDKQLKGIYKMATYQAQQGIVFANPVENPDTAPTEEVSK